MDKECVPIRRGAALRGSCVALRPDAIRSGSLGVRWEKPEVMLRGSTLCFARVERISVSFDGGRKVEANNQLQERGIAKTVALCS
jgi:hypothetical protein